MSGVLVAFVALSAVLWLSVFGYPLALRVIARQRRSDEGLADHPPVAVIVPVLNEEALIIAKLADLRRTDYPADRLSIWIVDGGSQDQTPELVRRTIDAGAPVHLLRLPDARGKTDQVSRALWEVGEEYVVVTDADAVLDPACIRELVATLVHDPHTAIVGAAVRPASALLEERVHWWLLNHLWWLEGEALSASLVSGVCYAARRGMIRLPLADGGQGEDAQIALRAGSSGLRVRLCRGAQATEVRVPQTAAELLRFRRRRGHDYVYELRRSQASANTPLGWRLVRGIRLWHFLVTPRVALALALIGICLLWTEHWAWSIAIFLAFAAPAVAAVARGTAAETDRSGWWEIGFATTRLVALTWLALLTLARYRTAAGED